MGLQIPEMESQWTPKFRCLSVNQLSCPVDGMCLLTVPSSNILSRGRVEDTALKISRTEQGRG